MSNLTCEILGHKTIKDYDECKSAAFQLKYFFENFDEEELKGEAEGCIWDHSHAHLALNSWTGDNCSLQFLCICGKVVSYTPLVKALRKYMLLL